MGDYKEGQKTPVFEKLADKAGMRTRDVDAAPDPMRSTYGAVAESLRTCEADEHSGDSLLAVYSAILQQTQHHVATCGTSVLNARRMLALAQQWLLFQIGAECLTQKTASSTCICLGVELTPRQSRIAVCQAVPRDTKRAP